jgi:hypothetical protein
MTAGAVMGQAERVKVMGVVRLSLDRLVGELCGTGRIDTRALFTTV